MQVTLLGIVIDVNPKQPKNAHSPIDVAESGRLTETKLERVLKAY